MLCPAGTVRTGATLRHTSSQGRKFHLEKTVNNLSSISLSFFPNWEWGKNTDKPRSDSGDLLNSRGSNNDGDDDNNNIVYWLPLFLLLGIEVWEVPKLYYQAVITCYTFNVLNLWMRFTWRLFFILLAYWTSYLLTYWTVSILSWGVPNQASSQLQNPTLNC